MTVPFWHRPCRRMDGMTRSSETLPVLQIQMVFLPRTQLLASKTMGALHLHAYFQDLPYLPCQTNTIPATSATARPNKPATPGATANTKPAPPKDCHGKLYVPSSLIPPPPFSHFTLPPTSQAHSLTRTSASPPTSRLMICWIGTASASSFPDTGGSALMRTCAASVRMNLSVIMRIVLRSRIRSV